MSDAVSRLIARVRQLHRDFIMSEHGRLMPNHLYEQDLDDIHALNMREEGDAVDMRQHIDRMNDLTARVEALEKAGKASVPAHPDDNKAQNKAATSMPSAGNQAAQSNDPASAPHAASGGVGTSMPATDGMKDEDGPTQVGPPAPKTDGPRAFEAEHHDVGDEEERHKEALMQEAEHHADEAQHKDATQHSASMPLSQP